MNSHLYGCGNEEFVGRNGFNNAQSNNELPLLFRKPRANAFTAVVVFFENIAYSGSACPLFGTIVPP